jgi:2,3-bisphosphoglycerate-independent phosphoglycerate mutase
MSNKTVNLLLILDGWGYSSKNKYNAISEANTPTWDNLFSNNPKTLLKTSGKDVGLPDSQMGNSEVGHMSIGAGRVIYQNLVRIDKDMQDKNFEKKQEIISLIKETKENNKTLHILGVLSDGGVHGSEMHMYEMCKIAYKNGVKFLVHVFCDGRDVPPKSILSSIEKLEDILSKSEGLGRIASVGGRYYSMDRDNNWERVELAYNSIAFAKGEIAKTAVKAIENSYSKNINDEFILPTVILNKDGDSHLVEKGDSLIHLNFRADRARELTKAFIEPNFKEFNTLDFKINCTTMIEFYPKSPCKVIYEKEEVKNSFGELLEQNNKTQLRMAETEKYAHVTFFFSCGREEEYSKEKRILVPSPKVATYDLQPEMSAYELTDNIVEAINSQEYDFIVCNYANGDMVGHSGIFDAAVKAAEVIDSCLEKIISAIDGVNGHSFITADHGNLESMWDEKTNQPHTSHTLNPVPFVYHGSNKDLKFREIKDAGLADIAPTIIHIMGLKQPIEMSGRILIETD